MKKKEVFMQAAIEEAKKAAAMDEVPIGCVIVHQDKIIARGYNQRNSKKTTLGHAELIAIQKASDYLGDWRLEGCDIYITLEPCPMCAGAMVQARIDQAYIGAMNPKAGCAGSVLNLLEEPGFNHQIPVETHVLGDECKEEIQSFFKRLRQEKKESAIDKG